jgi:hypothetical protein
LLKNPFDISPTKLAQRYQARFIFASWLSLTLFPKGNSARAYSQKNRKLLLTDTKLLAKILNCPTGNTRHLDFVV